MASRIAKLPVRRNKERHNKERRTQEERSSGTRARLLDATLECLLELGYSGTTTPVVCERTGLSRGALLHHFPTKQALVIEAVGRLVSRMNAENLAQAARVAQGADPLERMFDVLWTNFQQPLFHAALELWLAARTDRELHESLLRVERSRGRGMSRWYRSLAGPAAERPGFAEVLQLTLHLMRGMALQRLISADDTARARLYEVWKRIARAELDAAR
jgi:AcrR family transcriptional regulator